jgi:hypothetical protein
MQDGRKSQPPRVSRWRRNDFLSVCRHIERRHDAQETGGELALKDRWHPIQVKQKDKVGHPDIDSLEAMRTVRKVISVTRKCHHFLPAILSTMGILMAFFTLSENVSMNLKLKIKSPLVKFLSVVAVCGLAAPAYSLTIIPTFDSSITGATNTAAITNAINAALQVLQSNLIDNVTVKILFVSDESVGLGQSSTLGEDVAYSAFLAALKNHAASIRDTNAMSKLPNSPADPVIGGTQIHLTTAQARMLGLDTSYTGIDSTVSCKMSLMNFTRPPADPNKYDLQQVLEHEVDEVLGISSGLPATDKVWPADLFRYTTNLARTYTADGDDAYFSTDGTNLLARYNMDSGGDYGDWWSVDGNWSPIIGVTSSYPQVQDAFSGPGNALDLGVAELAALDVVGWTLATVPATPPALTIVRSAVDQFTLSWTNIANGYVLQERTNLISGAWAFSTTGSTNPAVLLTVDSQKFYRLYKPVSGSQLPAHNVVVAPAAHSTYEITTRIIQPRRP